MREGHQRLPERCAMAIASVVVRYPWGAVLIAVLFATIGVIVALNTIKLDADTNNLIAEDRPFMAPFREWMDEFGDLEYIYVVLDTKGDRATGELAVRALVEALSEVPDLPAIHGWISPQEQWRLATRAVSETDLSDFVRAGEALPILASSASAEEVLDQGLQRLNLTSATESELASGVLLLETIAGGELAQNQPTEFLTSENQRLFFVEIMPQKDFGTLAAIAQPLADIRTVISKINTRFPTIEIGVTGKPVLQADELATSDADMTRAAAIALVIITILFMIVFRGARRPLLAVLAFACAFAWTYGAVGILLGRLNLLSMVFMLVLVGIGLDYGIHIVARYTEARRDFSPSDAARKTISTAGLGNIFGAATSAGVFFLAMATSFGGLQELGEIAGIGLLFCVIAMCIVLPALLVITERTHPEPHRGTSFFSGNDKPTSKQYNPKLVLLFAAIGTVAFATAIVIGVRFEENLLELQAEGLESVEWEHRVMENDASSSWFAVAIAEDLQEVASITEKAKAIPEIGSIRSVLDVIPMPTPHRSQLREAFQLTFDNKYEQQNNASSITPKKLHAAAAKIRALPAVSQLLSSISERLELLADRLENSEEQTEALSTIKRGRDNAREAIQAMRAGNADSLRAALPSALRDFLVAPSGRFQVTLTPEENVWEYDPMARFVSAIREIDPNVTGVPITQFESMNDMRSSFILMGSLSFVLVVILVWIDFRSVRDTLLVLVTLLVGLVWTLGAISLLGVSLNLANFFAIPILMGIGVDSGIHMMQRARESKTFTVNFGSTQRAVILTAFTTAIGFGMLFFASHRGLQSLGVVMAIGSLCCLLAAIVLLPAMIELQRPKAS